ncbi:MAG: hypothetical protein HQL59_10440 [Magnetococcales bacterium]|nr:hypothetical protein [Magnetococcales bacterium]
MRSRVLAACSYLSVLCLVPLIFNRGDRFVDFHARQGLILWIWGVASVFAMHLPGLGPYLFSTSSVLISLFSVAGLGLVLLGRTWRLPLVAGAAERLFSLGQEGGADV